jgi:hypothetical protein
MRCGAAVSLMAQTGQSEAIHSPEAWAKTVLSRTMLGDQASLAKTIDHGISDQRQ